MEKLVMTPAIAGRHHRVYERDTDRLFIELFRRRTDIVDALARQVLGGSLKRACLVRGQVRHYAGSGSIDIEIDFENGPLLLIENKIDAAYSITRAGHGQPHRYQSSVSLQRRNGRKVHSVILAPARYLASSRLAGMFDAQVSYETFLAFLGGEDLRLVQAAIAQAEAPYEPIANALAGSFFAAVRCLIADRFPDLVMKHDPNADGIRPDASRTIYFDVPRTLAEHAGVPRPRMSLQCWDSSARSASVKVMLTGMAGMAAHVAVPQSLTDIGGYLRPAGRSLGIVIDTPRLDTQRPFALQADDIIEALEAALRLQAWWQTNGAVIRAWLQRSP